MSFLDKIKKAQSVEVVEDFIKPDKHVEVKGFYIDSDTAFSSYVRRVKGITADPAKPLDMDFADDCCETKWIPKATKKSKASGWKTWYLADGFYYLHIAPSEETTADKVKKAWVGVADNDDQIRENEERKKAGEPLKPVDKKIYVLSKNQIIETLIEEEEKGGKAAF